MKSILGAIIAVLMSLLGLHQSVSTNALAPSPAVATIRQENPTALAAAAAMTVQPAPPSAPVIQAHPAAPMVPVPVQEFHATSVQSTQPIQQFMAPLQQVSSAGVVSKSALADFVTQDQLEGGMSALGTSLRQLISQSSNQSTSGPGAPLSVESFAPSQAIDQLNGTVLNNVTINGVSGLSASEIPTLNYLPLSGGSLSGGLIVGGNSTTTGLSYFGGTVGIGTSTAQDAFAVNGSTYVANIAIPGITSNRLYANGGSLYWAGNLLSGALTGNWASDGTNVWRAGGNVGVGTTSPGASLAIAGNILVTATSTAANYLASATGSPTAPAYTFAAAPTTGIYSVGTNNLRFAANGVNSFTVTDSQVYVPLSGNANAPAISISASNLGFFSPSANVLGFSTGGTERMRLDGSGNLGIGTTSPGSILAVQGVGNFVANATSSIYNGLQAGALNVSGLTTLGSVLMLNATSTSLSVTTLGIGGANYFSSLTGAGLANSSGSLILDLTHANNWTGLQSFATASSTNLSVSGRAYFGGTATTTIDAAGNIIGAGTLSAGTTTITSLAVTNSSTSTIAGNLTIGANNPNYYPNTPLLLSANVNNYGQAVLQNVNSGANASADFIVGGNLMNDGGYFGDFGYNSSNNTGPFSANDTYLYSSDSNLDLAAASSSTGAINFFTGGVSTSTNIRLTIASGGNVGIGTTSLAAALTVAGGIAPTSTVYSSAGTGYSYTVPAGVTQLVVKTWGAGGGAGYNNGSTAGAGGGGGFAQSTITVTPGQTFTIDVGGGGGGSTSGSGGSGGTNGGGSGGNTGSSGSSSGGGGGYSDIRLSSTILVQAGGGGGGGDGSSSAGGAGGAGGGSSGAAGGNAGGSAGGAGGTSSAGGAGGGDPQNWCGSHSSGGSGSLNQGGNGLTVGFCNEVGGGGGGGHYGGGGGSMTFSGGGGGGGGGSDLVTGTNTIEITGSGSAAANTTDANYGAVAGAGGTTTGTNGNAGAPGRVVITTVSTAAVQITNASAGSVATFLGSGNVGFGTSTPTSALVVNGAASQGLLQLGTTTASSLFVIDQSGRVGINTATPGNYLAIATSSNLGTISLEFDGSSQYGGGFNDKSTGSTSHTMFNFMRNAAQVGSIAETNTATTYNTTSDRRLKENIATSTLGLSTLLEIPVDDFDFISDPNHVSVQGFIAQNLESVYPEAVTTNGDNGLVPLSPTSTPWSVDYGRLTPLIVAAVQDIANLSDTFKHALVAWFGNAANGIHDLYASVFHGQELCLTSDTGAQTCVNQQQLAALLAGSGASASAPAADNPVTSSSIPPQISISGSNPAIIRVGASYNDLGAAITGPEDDLNLGISTYVNGVSESPVVLDTSAVATDTIDYVVTDTEGLTSTSTRIVIIEAASDAPGQQGTGIDTDSAVAASSSDATSTAQ